jgi:uncharacterized membrane protein
MPQDFRQPSSYHEDVQSPLQQNASFINFTIATYAVFLIGIFLSMGIASIVGVIMAYVKRDDMAGSLYESHMTYLIRTFWFTLLGTIIGLLTLIIIIGFPILILVWIWSIYRLVLGLIRVNDNRAVNPYRWFAN